MTYLLYQFTILLVGYFVLGPSDLYKIVKEVGKLFQNFKTLSTDLTTSFENNMESQLQVEELRKAQRELTDAFSFRRSINVDQQEEAFTTKATNLYDGAAAAEDVAVPAAAAVGAAAATATAEPLTEPAKKLKIRRRVKKKPKPEEEGSVPDLEMPTVPDYAPPITSVADKSLEISDEEAALIDQEFDKYTTMSDDVAAPPTTVPNSENDDWYGAGAQTRFQQQMNGGWNDQIMENEDSLGLMAVVMNKIALLEKEKIAATARLEEEFQKRQELEDKFYQAQRKLLEDASQEVQVAAMGLKDSTVAAPADSKK
jgi:Sec-independent protein translocase protein TatA